MQVWLKRDGEQLKKQLTLHTSVVTVSITMFNIKQGKKCTCNATTRHILVTAVAL